MLAPPDTPAVTPTPAPTCPLLERHFTLIDIAATEAFALRFAQAIRYLHSQPLFNGLQVQLCGELGAGKTTLVRAALAGLGHTGRVRSPTYTLVEPYTLQMRAMNQPTGNGAKHSILQVYHFDLYRFCDPAEWVDAGFRDYLDTGALCLIEWPQKAQQWLRTPDLALTLELSSPTLEESRILNAYAYSELGKACLERC